MLVKRVLGGALVAASLLLAAGCSLFDNGDLKEDTSPIPGAWDNPTGFGGSSGLEIESSGAVGNGSTEWSSGAGPETTIPASAGELIPVDPGVNLNFPVIYFAYDTDVLVPSETSKLDKVASYLADQPALYLIIEGHCDQRGTEEYNRALGERRANAIRSYLTEVGVADSRIRTLSFGKDKPAVEGSGEEVWSQNRRGVLVPARKAGE